MCSSVFTERNPGRYAECFFFFSSRRRHTRFDCDWSSDVCSSDLVAGSGAHRGAIDADRHACGRADPLTDGRAAGDDRIPAPSHRAVQTLTGAMMAALRLRKPPVSLRCCLPLLCALAVPSAFASSLDLPALIECRQVQAGSEGGWDRKGTQ